LNPHFSDTNDEKEEQERGKEIERKEHNRRMSGRIQVNSSPCNNEQKGEKVQKLYQSPSQQNH
jgi:hypothetical protein